MKKAFLLLSIVLIVLALLTASAMAYSPYSDEYGYYEDYPSEYSETGDYDVKGSLLISLGVGVAVSTVVCIILYSTLKSVHFKNNANDYVKDGSMKLTRQSDLYLYSTVSRTPKPKNNNDRK